MTSKHIYAILNLCYEETGSRRIFSKNSFGTILIYLKKRLLLSFRCPFNLKKHISRGISEAESPEAFYRKCVNKNFANFTGNLCWSLSLIKLQLKACLFKSDSDTGVFL